MGRLGVRPTSSPIRGYLRILYQRYRAPPRPARAAVGGGGGQTARRSKASVESSAEAQEAGRGEGGGGAGGGRAGTLSRVSGVSSLAGGLEGELLPPVPTLQQMVWPLKLFKHYAPARSCLQSGSLIGRKQYDSRSSFKCTLYILKQIRRHTHTALPKRGPLAAPAHSPTNMRMFRYPLLLKQISCHTRTPSRRRANPC